jgi:high-affinity nickel permease
LINSRLRIVNNKCPTFKGKHTHTLIETKNKGIFLYLFNIVNVFVRLNRTESFELNKKRNVIVIMQKDAEEIDSKNLKKLFKFN